MTTGEPCAIRVEMLHRQRSCRAQFIATATLDCTDPRHPFVGLDLREHEEPPYSGWLCFPDVTIRITGLAPGRYRLEAPAMPLAEDELLDQKARDGRAGPGRDADAIPG